MGLLVEMELERLGEFLFRVSGRGVFGGIVVGKDGFDLLVKLSDGGDER